MGSSVRRRDILCVPGPGFALFRDQRSDDVVHAILPPLVAGFLAANTVGPVFVFAVAVVLVVEGTASVVVAA